MDILDNERIELETQIRKYKGRLNITRLCVYLVIAILFIKYAAPLFNCASILGNTGGDGSLLSTIIVNKMLIQFTMIAFWLGLNIFSYKTPLLSFIVLMLMATLVAFAVSAYIFYYVPRAGIEQFNLPSDTYPVLAAVYLICAALIWGVINAKKYNKIRERLKVKI